MKKYLLSALALPLLFACSSEDYLDQKAADNDQFAGIEKVDATFTMDEGPKMRMDNGTGWELKNGDLYGFAWLTDDHEETPTYAPKVAITGNAFQNHNLIQTNGRLEPQTSIYVGKYFIYRPYDKTTVAPGPIKFNSLMEQTLAEGQASGFGTDEVTPWKKLAESAIIIADKWTEILPAGHTYAGDDTVWDLPGIEKPYKVYAAFFSNQTGLDLTYVKNNPSFSADRTITGATDINLTYKAGEPVGAADIYGATVQLAGASNSFTYAPTTEPSSTHSGTFWADKSATSTFKVDNTNGFDFTQGAITLTAGENGVPTEGKTTGWFWFNSLPATAGDATETTNVITVLETSYGTVTVEKDYDAHTKYTVKDCAFAGNVESGVMVWHPLANSADATKTPTVWAIGSNNTFINQYGNHKGKFALTVDFSKGVMNNMHIKNDAHLQKALKYYIASGKTESVILKLDKDADGVFKISKLSIALLQTINAKAGLFNVGVRACDDGAHTPAKIIVTQDGQSDLGLANAKEVPALNNVFAISSDVYLSKDCEWTWGGGADKKSALNITNTGGSCTVKSITNEGTLTVEATNVELSEAKPLANAAGATMNITKVTTVKNALANLGTINVGAADNKTAELRAYAVEIKNDATALDAYGTINNFGVVGVTEGTTPAGQFNNYGDIIMKNNDAMTLLTKNEIGTDPFAWSFVAGTQMMGTVILPEGNPTAIVSVNNAAENGFIKYTWTGKTYATPEGNVKYNTIIVSDDITFDAAAPEVQYIEFNGTRTKVVNPETTAEPKGKLANLKGVIVNQNKSIIIEKGNILWPAHCGYLAPGATIYLGGKFTNGNGNTTVYLGTWSTDQIVKY